MSIPMSATYLISEKWDTLSWEFNLATGHLNVLGNGPMKDLAYGSDCAWNIYKNAIRSASVGEGVTSIGSAAFCKCGNLKSIELPASVTSIYADAFADCTALTSIRIPMGVCFIGRGVFFGCHALTNVEIPPTVTSIGSDAFKGCMGVIQIENGVKYVDRWAIECDTFAPSVVLRRDTVGIGCNAFSCCVRLRRMKLPTGVRHVSTCAFSNCKSLKSIVLPSNLESIGEMAFCECNSLKRACYPNRQRNWERVTIGYGNAPLLKALRFGRGRFLLAVKKIFGLTKSR